MWSCTYLRVQEYRAEMKDLRMPNTRTLVILIIISVALIATLGIGLIIGGGGEDEIIIHQDQKDKCPSTSPLYKEPSASREGHYSRAASAADSVLCSKLGSMMMEVKGASAVEAAISTAVCLGVTNPHSSGIGGGNFITHYKRATKEVHTVIGREQAPSGATMDMYSEATQKSSSQTGGMSVAVPGEVLGLHEAWKLGPSGKLAWKELFGPAIRVCTEGFWVGPSLLHAMHNTNLEEVPATFKEFITNPATGVIYKEGDKMYRPQLAKTLKIIAEEGPYAFYNGSLAENITLDIIDEGGIITMEDLASFTAPVKPAIVFHLRDNLTVNSPPPPSGGVVYQYILNILNGYEMDKTSVSTVDKAVKTLHRIIEAFKHAFSLRSELGDCDVGTDASKTYIHQLATNMTNPNFGESTRALISDTTTYDHAHYHQKYANAWDKGGSHFSVVGPNGDAVAVTSTINLDFGSKVIGSRTGIVFNDQMDAFSTPGANHIFPGKRPLSSMSPSIIVDGHGDVKLVIGASGGPKIITASALVTMETLWFDWSIKEAIDYHRMHHLPDELGVELGFPQVLIDGLQHMGHNVVVHPKASSVVQGIKRTGSQLSANSGKSVAVPGEVLGLHEAWKLGPSGKLAWKDLFGPAIRVCTEGFWVGPSLLYAMHNTNLEEVPATFKEFITNPATGVIYKEGDKMYRPQLAKTLKIIAEEGPYAFYNGSLAENITLDIIDEGGIITMEDLASFTAPVKPAIVFHLRDNLTVNSPPPPSGGVVYQYILNILNGYEMDKTSVSTVDKAVKTLHRIIEAFKHAFSLRSELGDCDVGTDASKTYIHQLATNMTNPNFGESTRALISDTTTYDHAHYHQKYANAWDKGGSHFSVVGPNGDAVAVTSTINLDFGSKVIGSRTGIVFNDQMDAFSTPGANHIFPGKRPLSSMSPSIIVDGHGDVKLVIGASGGPKIITASALVTMETLWFDWSIKEAIDYHRMHHLPDELGVELGFPQVLIDGLQHMGHNVVVHPKASSVVQGIKRTGSQLSANSGKSVAVPGEVLGLHEAWKLGPSGKLAWKDLFGPAIRVCTEGFWVGPSLLHAMHNTNLEEVPATFKEFITNPATGVIYKEGDKMYRPQLAKTLKIIAQEGPYAFYNGSLAENITLDIIDEGGIITMEDLASFTAPVKPAIVFHLRDNLTVNSPPPPSGGVVYQYILNILSGYEMDKTSVSTVDKAVKTFHRIIEAFKHAFSLRSELGDCDVGTDASKTYIHQLAKNMTNPNFGESTRALISDTTTYDHAHYHQKYANAWDKGGSHFSVVGPNGDAVAVTSTINLDFGSKVIGSRTGIVFNDQMDAFSTPGANHIFPGKRPLSSMSPSIIVDGHGDVKLVIGASGGPKIITASALVTMETLWFDWSIKEAIDYHRMHHLPDELGVELGFPQVLIDGLQHMGHNVVVHPKASSVVQGIKRTGSQLSANSDYRKGGEAQGYI